MAANGVVDLTLDDDDEDYVAPQSSGRQSSRRRPAPGTSQHAQPPPPPPSQSQKEEATECPICFDQMRESGDHRPSCLSCGHIFGQKCLTEWIEKQSWCPSCQKQSSRRDIRVLFGLPVLGADKQGLQKVTAQLEEERHKRHKAEGAVEKLKADARQRSEEHARAKQHWEREREALKTEIASLKRQQQQNHAASSSSSPTSSSSAAAASGATSQRSGGLASPASTAFGGGSPQTPVSVRSSKRKRTKN